MSTEPTIPIAFLRAALSAAERSGTDIDAILRRAGIPRALLQDKRARISAGQMARLLRALWKLTDDEMLGLGRARAPRGTFGLVAHALVSAGDLRTVFERMRDFQRAVPGLPDTEVTLGSDRTRLDFHTDQLADPDHLYVDFTLVLIQRFGSWLIGQPLRVESVELPYPAPDNATEYHVIFGGPVTFGTGRTALEFPSTLLDAPIVRTTADLVEYLRRAPEDMLRQRDYGSSAAQQVRMILEQGLVGSSWPTSDEVAQRLLISPGHLRRRLRAEGTSSGQIKEEILRDAAITALARGVSVEEIAQQLGFSEASAFRRAFKRWTGATPATYVAPDTP